MDFEEEKKVIKHELSPLINRPHQCLQCDKDFSYQSQLKIHLWTHNTNKLETCSYCKLTFPNKSIKQHLRTHTGEKPYKCSKCDKVYSRADTLKYHLLTHTDKKSYKCKECGKDFSQTGTLKQHLLTHSRNKYQCIQCNEVFLWNSLLLMHLRTHSLHKCSYCNMGLSSKSSLRKHLRIHTGEKPYKCSKCDMFFATKGELIKHLRTHVGEKKNDYSQCDSTSSQSYAFKCYSKTQTRGKQYKYIKCDKAISTKLHNYMPENVQITSNYLQSKTRIPEDPKRPLSKKNRDAAYEVSNEPYLFNRGKPKQIYKRNIDDNSVSKHKLGKDKMECKEWKTKNIKQLKIKGKETPMDVEIIYSNEEKKEHIFVHTGIL